MAHIGNRFGLVVSLFCLACPRGLLGLDTTLRARQFFCYAPRDAGPNWLVGRGSHCGTRSRFTGLGECGHAAIAVSSARLNEPGQHMEGRSTSVSQSSAWTQAGICGLEFGTAAVGSAASAVGALYVAGTVFNRGEDISPPSVLIAGGMYALTSTFMSAAGTYLIGRLFGQGGTFSRTLIGGACGGVVGGSALVLLVATNDPPLALIPLGAALPALGAVVAHNTRRDK
jgi:hypothetical protein